MPILPTHKEGIIYLEHCRVSARDGMLVLTRKKDAFEKHWSIPYGNLNVLLLGSGTSLSQQASKLLSSEGVMVAFTGGGGMPVFLASQSEYRKPEFLQGWMKMWMTPNGRLNTAKNFQLKRCSFVKESWNDLFLGKVNPIEAIEIFERQSEKARSINELMGYEANFAKTLFKLLAENVLKKDFQRKKTGDEKFSANHFLSNGNYLAYGLAACVLWVLGIPHSLPISHGATRRGALVFDIADLVKDACIMPLAFIASSQNYSLSQFRKECILWLEKMGALEMMFEEIKKVAEFWNDIDEKEVK